MRHGQFCATIAAFHHELASFPFSRARVLPRASEMSDRLISGVFADISNLGNIGLELARAIFCIFFSISLNFRNLPWICQIRVIRRGYRTGDSVGLCMRRIAVADPS
jgi:hypothetical protein